MKNKFIHLPTLFKDNILHKTTLPLTKILLIPFEYTGQYLKYTLNKNKYPQWQSIYTQTNNLILTNKNKIITCITLSDTHTYTFTNGLTGFAKYCATHHINFIRTRYNENQEYTTLQKLLTKHNAITKLITVPLTIDPNIFKNYNQPKTIDILYYGAHGAAYPFRNRLYNLLIKLNKAKTFKISILKYGDYWNADLAKEINKSHLCIATKSKYDYLVEKYFEIPAAKSTLLGDMPKQGIPIFKNNYIHINNTMSDKEIINIIKIALSNKYKKTLQRKSNASHNTVHKHHIKQNYYKNLYKQITSS